MATVLAEEPKKVTKKDTQKDITSLRSALEWLDSQGDVMTTDVEVDPDLEITGVQKHLDGGPVVLFNRVKGKPHARAITNLLADMNVIDKLFDYPTPKERTKKIAYSMTHPIAPVEVSQDEAPCQEEVFTDDLDVNKYITAIRHTELESELTIGSGISCVIGDYFDGGSHIGYNRMNFRWGNVGTFQASPGSHMWQVITEHYKDEKPIPLTMCFGVPPSCTLVAGGGFDYVILPKGCDEIGVAGAIQGSPVNIVKARTVDAYAIAESEYVLEGLLYPRDKRYETAEAEKADTQGKYFFHPEWAGYMGKAYKAATFHVTAITMRKRETRPLIYFLGAILACNQGMRLAIAESPDIDIYSMDDIIWSLTTRVNPHTDIINPLPGGIGQTFQPQERMTAGDKEWTASNTRFEGGMGIDATVPFGYEQDFHRPVYPIDKVDPLKFFSQSELDRAKERMHGWVEVLARTGR